MPERVEAAAESLPLDEFFAPLPVVAAGQYGQELSSCLLAFKDRGRLGLRNVLAPALARSIHRLTAELSVQLSWHGVGDHGPRRTLYLVPVPGRLSARLRRGYFPVGVLLASLEHRGLLPASCRVASLVGVREGWTATIPEGPLRSAIEGALDGGVSAQRRGQKVQGRRSRTAVRGTMRWVGIGSEGGDDLEGQPCLLIDDVLTTGATLSEVYRVVTEAGMTVLGAAVVAATHSPRATSAESETEISVENLDSGPG
ncbi:ComF family protein [Zhihengliuella flava]|uniref:Amidophosphoribosyltransferase n=1 Tax=Zhihengliuella flava TaxID=1285193 RepID=A0A931GMP0_9MICC|nr:phosphoribosyltransferase family protein [Zhihengliuella flava]MBG6085609.1 putative amidophosphoribosyltransferase [Zhihengliuella flava]